MVRNTLVFLAIELQYLLLLFLKSAEKFICLFLPDEPSLEYEIVLTMPDTQCIGSVEEALGH